MAFCPMYHIYYKLSCISTHVYTDPDFQREVPILDGGESCSEHIIHGSNVDVSPTAAAVNDGEHEPGRESSVDRVTEPENQD